MKILGIETSCDETSAAVLDGREILSNVIYSQINTHKIYGGVVPEIAAREHLNKLPIVIDQALKQAKVTKGKLDGIAVTYGPGLAGALIVGLSYAKSMAFSLKKKFVGINHLEAHLLSPFLENEDFKYPFIGVVVSGGHTNIYVAKKFNDYELIAATRDDAAGEAFDKVAKMLGLPYPGGPSVSKAAKKGEVKDIVFPQARMKDKSMDFSFSGLKTSVLYYIKNNEKRIEKGEITIEDIAAAFQQTIVRTIISRVKRTYETYNIKSIAISGGVAANAMLKEELEKFAMKNKMKFYVPSPILCTDNGAMIAYAGHERIKRKIYSDWDLEAYPNLKIK